MVSNRIKITEEGEVYEFSNLLAMIKKDIEKYKDN